MKKPVKIILIILLALIVGTGIFTALEWSNIKSYVLSHRYSSDELQSMISEEEKKRDETIKSVSNLGVREFSDEEKKKIADGEISEEDALKLITSPEPDETEPDKEQAQENGDTGQADEKASPASDTPQEDDADDSETDKKLSNLVAQVYVLEAKYSGAVDTLMANAINEYTALPSEEHTDKNKYSIASKYLNQAASMESDCDAQMTSILDEMTDVLVKAGRDTSLADQIKDTYYSEKSLKKAYYLSKYS